MTEEEMINAAIAASLQQPAQQQAEVQNNLPVENND